MIIYAKIKPNANEEKIKRISKNEFEIWIKEPAKEGKANIRLIRLLSRRFNVSGKDIKIKNPSSRKKIIEIKKN